MMVRTRYVLVGTSFDGLPSVREITSPELVRLAVRAAYAVEPASFPPANFAATAALLARGEPPAWVFQSAELAADWARSYAGPQADRIRFLVLNFAAARAAAPQEEIDPQLYEVTHGTGSRVSNG